MKTRAWDGNQLRTDYVLLHDGSIWLAEPNDEIFGSILVTTQVDWKLSRFTEFTDIDSHEIWQYCIVDVHGIKAVVHFEFGRFILVSAMYPDGYIEIIDLITVEGKEAWLDVKVIGDVYQNPELLDEVKA